MYEILLAFVHMVETFGYLGIFIATFIESTFIPIPSEMTLIPAGYLITNGDLNLWITLFCSLGGLMGGSLLNYMIAKYYGSKLLLRYGKYFFLNEAKMHKIESFFHKHGAISVFSGRLLPGLKHFISFPAGLARMDMKLFCIYTLLGGFIWTGLLIMLGYTIGSNKILLHKYLKQINIVLIISLVCVVAIYSWYRRANKA